MRRLVIFLLCILLLMCQQASAILIDFEEFTGPNNFEDAGSAQTLTIATDIGDVVIEGGVILDEATILPANQTSVYGTSHLADSSHKNPLTITFPCSISNLFLNLYTATPADDTLYFLEDNADNLSYFRLEKNLDGGLSQIGFATSGSWIRLGAYTYGSVHWKYLIDNIHFNEPLPPEINPIPEPSTIILMSCGLLGLLGIVIKKRRKEK